MKGICRDCYWCHWCRSEQKYMCRNIDSRCHGEYVHEDDSCYEFEPNEELFEGSSEDILYRHYGFC